ncbi:MAG TPA: gluconokinase, partial [Opitutaceae bacterium]
MSDTDVESTASPVPPPKVRNQKATIILRTRQKSGLWIVQPSQTGKAKKLSRTLYDRGLLIQDGFAPYRARMEGRLLLWNRAAVELRRMVIIVMGVSGCGKSTIGRLLADRQGATFLDVDDFHTLEAVAKMRSGTSLTDEDRAGWLFRLCAEIEQRLGSGENLVL